MWRMLQRPLKRSAPSSCSRPLETIAAKDVDDYPPYWTLRARSYHIARPVR